MKVLCAGFPKTGTKSMTLALRELGYSVHDFEEHLQFNLDNYLDYFEGRLGDEVFLEMYKDVDVDVLGPHQQFSFCLIKKHSVTNLYTD